MADFEVTVGVVSRHPMPAVIPGTATYDSPNLIIDDLNIQVYFFTEFTTKEIVFESDLFAQDYASQSYPLVIELLDVNGFSSAQTVQVFINPAVAPTLEYEMAPYRVTVGVP